MHTAQEGRQPLQAAGIPQVLRRAGATGNETPQTDSRRRIEDPVFRRYAGRRGRRAHLALILPVQPQIGGRRPGPGQDQDSAAGQAMRSQAQHPPPGLVLHQPGDVGRSGREPPDNAGPGQPAYGSNRAGSRLPRV